MASRSDRPQFERHLEQLRKLTDFFSRKWHPRILYTVAELDEDEASFTEIETTLDGISPKMLSEGLDTLCERGLLMSTRSSADNRRTAYQLTQAGHGFMTAVSVFFGWWDRYQAQQPTILIIEDEVMVGDLMTAYLDDGYDVTHKTSGESGLAAFNQDIDIVILDRKLPDATGRELSKKLRSQNENCLILAVSGIPPGDKIIDLKMDEYIQKPVSEEQLIECIENLLTRRDLRLAEQKYLSIRSKQRALIATHGDTAPDLDIYEELNNQIDELNVSEEEQDILDEF